MRGFPFDLLLNIRQTKSPFFLQMKMDQGDIQELPDPVNFQ